MFVPTRLLMAQRLSRLLFSVLVLTASACDPGDDYGDGQDDAPQDASSGGTRDDATDDPAAVSFEASVAPILESSCGCHIGGAGGLAFGDDPYDALVGAPARALDMPYVEPGDLEGSYLVHKLRGTQADVGGNGGPMPIGDSLSEDQVATIEAWVEAGAPD